MSSKKSDPPDDGGGRDKKSDMKMKEDSFAGEEEDEEDWPICIITSTTTVGATSTASSKIDSEGDEIKSEGQSENKKDTSNAPSTSQNSKQSASPSSPPEEIVAAPASQLKNQSSSSITEKSTEKSTKTISSTQNGSSSSSSTSAKHNNSSSGTKSLEVKAEAKAHHDDDDGLVEKSVKHEVSEPEQPPKQQHNRFVKVSTSLTAPSVESSSTNQSLLGKDKPKEMKVTVKQETFKVPAPPPPLTPPHPPTPTLPLYACPKCDLEFTTRSILNTHLNDAHPIVRKASSEKPTLPPKLETAEQSSSSSNNGPGGPPYDCPECNHRFPNPFQLKKHSIIHNKPLQCPLCPQTYLAMEALNLHKRYIHDSSKLHWFKCQICGKSDFLLLSDLYTHRVESHPEVEWMGEREKPFGCGICERPCLRKGDALVCAVLGHEPGGIGEVMFQWKCEECPEGLGFWRVEELREHWERRHNDKEMPGEVMMGEGGGGEQQLPCVQIDKREAYDLKENWRGEGEERLVKEFELVKGVGGRGRRGCVIPVFGCPDCSLTFVDVESLRIHEKVHLRDEGPPMPSPVRKRGRPSSKSGRGNGGGEGDGEGQGVKKGSAGILQFGSPDKHQEPISLVEENGGRGKHLVPKYDCRVCGKRFRKLKRLRDHEVYHKMEDPDCPVFPKVMGRGGRKKGTGGGGGGMTSQGKTAMQKSIAHAGGILRKRGRGRPKKIRVEVSPRKREMEVDDDEEDEEEEGGGGDGPMEWWEEALLDEEEMEEEKEFKCKTCDAAFHLARALRMHELAAHNAPHRKPGRKPRGVGVNGEGDERLVEGELKKKKVEKGKVKRKLVEEMEVKPLRPGRIKVGRLEISTRLNKEIRDSEPIRLASGGRDEEGRRGPQYKCPKCDKEFRDKRGIHLHILGHSLKGGPGEKQMKLDEDGGKEEDEEGSSSPPPGEIGERRTSDRERKVPRKLSDFEVDEGEGEEVISEGKEEAKVTEDPAQPIATVTVAEATPPPPSQVVKVEKKRKALPKELYGEVVKNMTIMQAEGKLEERKEVNSGKVTAEVASSAFEKISGRIVGMKKDRQQQKKKNVKIIKSGVKAVVGEGEGPPVPDYYGGEGEGTSDKVTCQTCLKVFESVEVLWYHCSQEHFNKGGKVKYIPKEGKTFAPTPAVVPENLEVETPKKELKTYGSAKKPAFLALLEKRREAQSPSPPKVQVSVAVEEDGEAPAIEAVTGSSDEAVPPPPPTEGIVDSIKVPVIVAPPSQSQNKVAVIKTTPSRPPPPALIPLSTITGRDKKGGTSGASAVPVQSPVNVKTTPTPPPPPENVNKVSSKVSERSMSTETDTPPKSKPEVKVNQSKPVIKKAPPPPPTTKPEMKTLKVTPPQHPVVKKTPSTPETVKSPPVHSQVKQPEVTKTFTIKSNPDLSISIVKTRPSLDQVYTSSASTSSVSSTSISTTAVEPKPEVSISLVKARQRQQQLQQQNISKQPSQLSVSLVNKKVGQVPVPSQFKKSVPNYKLSELIKCASKKHPIIQPRQPNQPPQLPKLSQQAIPQFSKQRPPPLTPAPGAAALGRSPPKPPMASQSAAGSVQVPVSKSPMSMSMPALPRLEGQVVRKIGNRKIIIVSKSALMTSPPKVVEATIKKQLTTPSSPPKSVTASAAGSPPKLEETPKKKWDSQVTPLKEAPKPITQHAVPTKKVEAIQNASPKMEDTVEENKIEKAVTPPSATPATPKLSEDTLKKKQDNQKVTPKSSEPPQKLEETSEKKVESEPIQVAVPTKLLEDSQRKPGNEIVSPSPPIKPATAAIPSFSPPKLEEPQKKTETKKFTPPPPTEPTRLSAPPKLREPPKVENEVEKTLIASVPEKPVKPTRASAPPNPKLEETPEKPETKKPVDLPPTKATASSSVPPEKLKEAPKVEKKSEAASKQLVKPAPPNKLEETDEKPEIKISKPTRSSTAPPEKLEETSKPKEETELADDDNSKPEIPQPPLPKLEEPPIPEPETPIPPVLPKSVEETTANVNQSAVSGSSSSSARVAASAPHPKSPSSTENPPSQPTSSTLQKPPLLSPTANEFRFKIIKQSVILPFKKRPGRPSPKYLEYLEGKQKGSKKLKAATAASASTSSTAQNPGISSETPSTLQNSQQTNSTSDGGNLPPTSKKSKLSLPQSTTTTTQPIIKIESCPSLPPSSETTPSPNPSTSTPPIKRKRGRPWPPKNPAPTQTTAATTPTPLPTSNGTPPIKRKRGRPWGSKAIPKTPTTPPTPSTPPRPTIKPSPYSPDITTSLRRKPAAAPAPQNLEATPTPPAFEQSVEEVSSEQPPSLELVEKPKGRPGRPRIHPIIEKDPNAPKRKRGRPPKSVNNSMEESSSPNGLSMSTTASTTTEEESFNDSSILSPSTADETLNTEEDEETTPVIEGKAPERKRGRPFKKRRGRLPYKATLPVNQNQPEKVDVGVSRRHSIANAGTTVAPPDGGQEGQKRGRGRPRKSMPILTPAVD